MEGHCNCFLNGIEKWQSQRTHVCVDIKKIEPSSSRKHGGSDVTRVTPGLKNFTDNVAIE